MDIPTINLPQKKIVIGNNLFTFDNNSIRSIESDTACALSGEELFIDQHIADVNYYVNVQYRLKTLDDCYIKTKSGSYLCSKRTNDIRLLDYGTPVYFYKDDIQIGKAYLSTVERIGREEYRLTCISEIGLMDGQIHKGGLYSGESFTTVLNEITGGQYQYTVTEDVAKLRVYGWLPYATKRENLYSLIFAMGVNILHDDNGNMVFTFLTETEPTRIPDDRLFDSGAVKYDAPASRVEVTEHAYHYLEELAVEETLFNNLSSGSADESTVTFDKPIKAETIRVTDGNMTIVHRGTNYAVVHGNGILVGKPYIHTTRVISADNSKAKNEKIVRIQNATLINLFNSENVLDRTAQYYFNATTITGDIDNVGEKCGRRYQIQNAYHESEIAFLAKMTTRETSFARSACEFISGYIPLGKGSQFSKVVILGGSGVWNIPQEVYEKPTPTIRVVLIGQGYQGNSGNNGMNGFKASTSRGGDGGDGGAGGAGGAGGKVYIAETINCIGRTAFNYAPSNGNTVFWDGTLSLSSASGTSLVGGYLEPFTGKVYALQGRKGRDGAAGGTGGLYTPTGSIISAENGNNITHNGQTWYGGQGLGYSSYYIGDGAMVYYGGGGGGGAAVGNNGGNSSSYNPETGATDQWTTTGYGGAGANAGSADVAVANYGNGGNGGHGGGGGGGGSVGVMWNIFNKYELMRIGTAGGLGGVGGNGSTGYPGCVIIYY